MDKISLERINKFKEEISGDTKDYLENCLNEYSDYVSLAQIIFPEIYKKMDSFDKAHDISEYLNAYDEAIKSNDTNLQIEILKKEINKGIYTPAVYDRLARIYERLDNIELAYKMCILWFETDFWKIPNMAKGSLKILKRIERLEKKYSA